VFSRKCDREKCVGWEPSWTMSNRSKLVHSDPNILSGTPVFVGTRVPLHNLFDYLEAGDTIDDFLKSFPSVSRDQAIAALEIAREALEASTDV